MLNKAILTEYPPLIDIRKVGIKLTTLQPMVHAAPTAAMGHRKLETNTPGASEGLEAHGNVEIYRVNYN